MDVLASRQFGMKARSDLEQAGNTPGDLEATGGGVGDSREDLEEGRFPSAVPPNDSHDFTGSDLEIDIAQGPERLGGSPLPRQGAESSPGAAEEPREAFAEGPVGGLPGAKLVAFAEAGDANGGDRHEDSG